MIAHFDRMGIVEPRDGPKSGPFPAAMEVQDLLAAHPLTAAAAARTAEHLDLSGIEKVRRFPHGLMR
jgi:hypothetical protein